MKFRRPKNQEVSTKGFSLVELMVVVAIIGVLASLAVPRFKTFQAKARQAEAKTNLAHLYTLQQSYYADYDKYWGGGGKTWGFECDQNPLGFMVTPCGDENYEAPYSKNKRYAYKVEDGNTEEFVAKAKSQDLKQNRILAGCTADLWKIDQDKTITAERDVTKNCKD